MLERRAYLAQWRRKAASTSNRPTALDAGEMREVAVGVQFQGAQPGPDVVIDLPEFDKTEAQRLMDEGIPGAVIQSFFISRLGAGPVPEANALKSALAGCGPGLELGRDLPRERPFLLQSQQAAPTILQVVARRRILENGNRQNQFAKGAVQVLGRRVLGIEQAQAGAVVFPALDQRFHLDQKIFRLGVVGVKLQCPSVASGRPVQLAQTSACVAEKVMRLGVYRR